MARRKWPFFCSQVYYPRLRVGLVSVRLETLSSRAVIRMTSFLVPGSGTTRSGDLRSGQCHGRETVTQQGGVRAQGVSLELLEFTCACRTASQRRRGCSFTDSARGRSVRDRPGADRVQAAGTMPSWRGRVGPAWMLESGGDTRRRWKVLHLGDAT